MSDPNEEKKEEEKQEEKKEEKREDEGEWHEPASLPPEEVQSEKLIPQKSQQKTGENTPFPLADSAVMEEIREAEKRAKATAASIAKMRESIQELTKKDELSPEEMDELQAKQAKIVAKLSEFEGITKRIQFLVGLADVDSGMLEEHAKGVSDMSDRGGPSSAPSGREPMEVGKPVKQTCENLPKVIIPPGMFDQVPKIIVCEPMKDGNKSGKTPLYQQFTGKQQSDPCGGTSSNWPRENFPPPDMPQLPPVPLQMPPMHPGMPPQMGPMHPAMMAQMAPPMLPPMMAQMAPPMLPPQMAPMMQQQMMAPPQTVGPPHSSIPGQQMGPNFSPPEQMRDQDNLVEQLSGRLDASYRMQEKLVQENADMEGHRYQLQEELLNKDQTMESLQKQMQSLQNEMRAVTTENSELKERLKTCGSGTAQAGNGVGKPLCKMSLSKEPICKLELYKQMGLPLPMEGPGQLCVPNKTGEPRDMDTLVEGMEEEVRAMQKELAMVQAERRSLDLQKKLLKCANPKQNAQMTFPTSGQPVCKRQIQVGASTASSPELPQPPPPPPPPRPQPSCVRELESQLRELKEQYTRLQEDFNAKVAEISVLRVEMESAKTAAVASQEKAEEAEARVDDLLDRLKVVENEKSKMAGSKDQLLELEQQMIVAKQRFMEGQDEVEEMRTLIQDQACQLEEYRNKYICAQEIVEEQRRQIDQMEMNTSRFSEQLNKELQQVKGEFQKRLEELSPLPDLLKATQLKLQETQQLRMIAERSCEELTVELDELKDRLEAFEVMERTGSIHTQNDEDNKAEVLKLKAVISRLEEMTIEHERKLEEKNQLVVQLQSQLETLREESARQVARTKERCDVVRRGLQGQISDLEVQLAQSRATARAAQRDRDEIRQKMQAQITALTKNFDQAQGWVRCLQSHVNFLKTSNKNVLFPGKEATCLPKPIDPNLIQNDEQA